jgi:hypothetical protein
LNFLDENLTSYLNATAPSDLLAIVGQDDTLTMPSDATHVIGAGAGIAYDQV